MANLKDIKLRITSVQKTQQITKAMKMVAASKMKKATNSILSLRPFAEKLERLINHLKDDEESFVSSLMDQRAIKRSLLIVVAADKGLCGGFNTNIRKLIQQRIQENKEASIETKLIVVGKKALEFSNKLSTEILSAHVEIYKDLNFNNAVLIMKEAQAYFENATVDSVELIYNRFVNAITQLVEKEQLLPLVLDGSASDEDSGDYIYEPSKVELLSNLIPKHLNFKVWKALLESNASEQAARMMAMDNATNNADDMIKKLKQVYNRIRQASITTEISEIVGGAAALQE